MTAIELYKKLPKRNCGACAQTKCMPFAMAVTKGEAEPEGCPLLSDEELASIRAVLTRKDWRAELIARLQAEIGTLRLTDIAEGIGAETGAEGLSVTCMGREFIVSPSGEISTQGHITPWMKILLLHYIRTAGSGPLSGRWVSYADLRGGMVKITSFRRECEEPLRELFDRGAENTGRIIERLGATKEQGFPTRYAWRLSLLPKLPVIILYWPSDDEFPAKVSVLFDSTADRFLDAESLVFLVEGLAKNIEMQLSRQAR